MQLGMTQFTAAVAHDGTDTVATIFLEGQAVAEGRARRMKGDARNPQLGITLATARAFQQVADQEQALADEILNPPKPEPSQSWEWIKDVFARVRQA